MRALHAAWDLESDDAVLCCRYAQRVENQPPFTWRPGTIKSEEDGFTADPLCSGKPPTRPKLAVEVECSKYGEVDDGTDPNCELLEKRCPMFSSSLKSLAKVYCFRPFRRH